MDLKFIKENSLFLFLFFIFLILGILVLTNYYSAKSLQTEILIQYNDHRDLLLEKAAFNIEEDISGKKLEMNLLDKKIILDEMIFNSCSGILFSPKTNSLSNLENYFVISKSGKIISCSDSNYLDYLNLNLGDTDYFKRVLISGNTIIKHIKTSNPGQLYLLTPITTSNKNKFDAVALLSVVEISDLYSRYIHELIGNNNYYYLFDKTNNKIIIKEEHLDDNMINLLKEKSFYESELLTFDSKNFVFNKKQLKVGDEIWELGVLSSTEEIETMFYTLNKKHLISIFFILFILGILFIILLKTNNLKKNAENKLKKAELTLENYKINIDYETTKSFSVYDKSLKSGEVYIFKDDTEKASELFVKHIGDKKIGLGFMKQSISNFKSKYNLDKTSLVKLSTEESLDSKYKTAINITLISQLIKDFISKTNRPKIIYIDSLDFIILQNEFKEVLTQLYELKAKIKNSNNILIFSLNQNAINDRELLALEKEFIDIEKEEKKSLGNISNLEKEMLIFINNLNNNKIQVRYKDISHNFSITKPTTRKRILGLEGKGLIIIEDDGRNKLVKITLNGRKFI